jgi:predicted DNA-binding transcriptional regulator AlpA
METFSTRQAAKKLGLTQASLSRYIAAKKIPTPKMVQYGGFRVHVWSEADIERVRALLPKIANGRKTRHQKQRKKTTGRKSKT